MELSFGEQIKILLNRKHMTIQDLADRYEAATGNKMSRQNLTQRLKRDNFPEQDMYLFASLLDCKVSIQLEPLTAASAAEYSQAVFSRLAALTQTGFSPDETASEAITGSVKSFSAVPDVSGSEGTSDILEQTRQEPDNSHPGTPEGISFEIPEAFRRQKRQGEINPMTGEEYLTNTVRRHPDDPDYIQVYDRKTHCWADVAEDYFWDFQQKKKQMLGRDYQEPLLI